LNAKPWKENSLKAFIIGLLLGVIAVPAAVYFYFTSGSAPVATSAPPLPFERKFANSALHARIEREMPKTAPIAANEEAYIAAAPIYVEHCAVCHGLPGQEQTAIAKGMFPKPPHLFRGTGVTDDEPGETYWKVTNGIRLTGMPGFDKTLSDVQRWQVSLLLANADKISDAIRHTLTAPPAAEAVTQPAGTAKPPHTR
jgi:thiosulfate dehydrogenase